MKAVARASRGWLAGAAFAAVAAVSGPGAHAQPPAQPDFGEPPSGEIPILFNDHHVYARPSHLKQGRVLAAIVHNNAILVPLRSIFEQVGAGVAYDKSTQTVDVAKPGADVKVTVGKAWVVVNGDERPLDVAPMWYHGSIVVPLRVISEGLGAYVQWVPEKHLVVIRYVESAAPLPPSTPAPTARPTRAPSAAPSTPAPSPTANAAAAAKYYEAYVAGDYLISPKVYNELSPGNSAHSAYEIKGAVEFPLLGPSWELSANYRHFLYPHNASASCATTACSVFGGASIASPAGLCPSTDQGCVTTVGFPLTQSSGLGQIYVTAFTAQESDLDAHFGVKVLNPRIYLAAAGLFKNYNYLGYPSTSGIGFGLEKLPDFDQKFSLYGSAFYYPNVNGRYTFPGLTLFGTHAGQQITVAYSEWKYEIGGAVALGSNLFLDFGYAGIQTNAKTNAPSGTSIAAPYIGLGLHF